MHEVGRRPGLEGAGDQVARERVTEWEGGASPSGGGARDKVEGAAGQVARSIDEQGLQRATKRVARCSSVASRKPR